MHVSAPEHLPPRAPHILRRIVIWSAAVGDIVIFYAGTTAGMAAAGTAGVVIAGGMAAGWNVLGIVAENIPWIGVAYHMLNEIADIVDTRNAMQVPFLLSREMLTLWHGHGSWSFVVEGVFFFLAQPCGVWGFWRDSPTSCRCLSHALQESRGLLSQLSRRVYSSFFFMGYGFCCLRD